MAQTRLEKLQEKKAKLQKELLLEKSKERVKQRKTETRAKILIGGAFLALLKGDKQVSDVLVTAMVKLVAEKDREMVQKVINQAKAKRVVKKKAVK